jgi:glycosyltransferase involved in cell wall biosynthesis
MNKINDLTISAVIACYKDGEAIPLMHSRLTDVFQKIGCKYEIIFVNDGSPDNSENILEDICSKDLNTTAIFHSRNFNSQNAFTSGMKQATGDAVVLLDGDLQDPPELIQNFAYKWMEGYDVVYGSRIRRDASNIMNYAYKTFYRIFNKISYLEIPLDAGDFSLMDRRVVDEINKTTETDRFIRGLRAWVGFKQVGVPYIRPERKFGVSTNNFFMNMKWAKKGIFSFSYFPLEIMSIFSYLIVLISALALFAYIIFYFVFPNQPKGITTLIVLILFMGGVQLLSISILSEYIGKILEETKKRPNYIVKKILNNKKK